MERYESNATGSTALMAFACSAAFSAFLGYKKRAVVTLPVACSAFLEAITLFAFSHFVSRQDRSACERIQRYYTSLHTNLQT